MDSSAEKSPDTTRRSRQWGWLSALLLLATFYLVGRDSARLQRSDTAESASGTTTPPDTVQNEPVRPQVSPASLLIQSDPPGASFFLNDLLLGATPLAVEDLQPGNYAIRLEKKDCHSQTERIELAAGNVTLFRKMKPLPKGRLHVDVQPRGAEVLLNGQLVGHSPAILDDAPVGRHELVIRKINFETLTSEVLIEADKQVSITDLALGDRILQMLEGSIRAEPQDVGHYLDLAHYHFVNERLDEAVAYFVKAKEVGDSTLELPAEYTAEQRAFELRKRKDDLQRIEKELKKHREWDRVLGPEFSRRMTEAIKISTQRNLHSWVWVEGTAAIHMRASQWAQARDLLLSHLPLAPEGPDKIACRLMLLRAQIRLRDLPAVKHLTEELTKTAETTAQCLDAGKLLLEQRTALPTEDRNQALALAELLLRKALEKQDETLLAQVRFELANVKNAQGELDEAITLYRSSIQPSDSPKIKEFRAVGLAEALRKAGRLQESRIEYEQLVNSTDAPIRERAKTGLLLIKAELP